MKNKILVILLVLWAIPAAYRAMAQEEITTKINIPVSFPQKYNDPMKAKPILEKPLVVLGNVQISIAKTPTPDDVKTNRYLVEYFIDDDLIFSTNGENKNNPESPSFNFVLDTARYDNGSHKIIVNFWDKDGPSAIGFYNIIIENPKYDE